MKNYQNKHINKNYRKTLLLAIGIIQGFISLNAASETRVAGKTLLAKGEVNAINPDTNDSRSLKRRSEIFSIEHIITGNKSKAQFSMADGGLITLKENTEINVSHYEYNEVSKKGSATLEVISGGLRSISGLIKKSGGDYQVVTPVGSIGIRGTHFAVEVIGDDVLFGVFSGNIDIKLNNNETLSLGESEGFAFASINELGSVTTLTQAPAILTQGFSDITGEQEADNSSQESPVNTQNNVSPDNLAANSLAINVLEDTGESNIVLNDEVYSESEWQGTINTPIADLLSERTGTFNYQDLSQSNVSSSVGATSNFSMNLQVDFDNGSVPGGAISFNDAQGEWFATYSGLINIDELDIDVTFASHANKKADGDISAAFSNGLNEITGRFNLHEIEDQTITANGSFKIN